MFGGLRIDLSALETAEHFLESSGWACEVNRVQH